MTVARRPTDVDHFETLLDAADGGNERALSELNRRYSRPLVRTARRMGALDPEQVANQALFDGIRSIDSLRNRQEPSFRRYLYTCVANQVRSEHRRLRPILVPLDPAVHGTDPDLDPGELIAGPEWFDAALDQLPAEQRAVISRRFGGGLTVRETAAVLGKTPDSVKHLQARALVRIGSYLAAAGVLAVLVVIALLPDRDRSVVVRIEPVEIPAPQPRPDGQTPDGQTLDGQTLDGPGPPGTSGWAEADVLQRPPNRIPTDRRATPDTAVSVPPSTVPMTSTSSPPTTSTSKTTAEVGPRGTRLTTTTVGGKAKMKTTSSIFTKKNLG